MVPFLLLNTIAHHPVQQSPTKINKSFFNLIFFGVLFFNPFFLISLAVIFHFLHSVFFPPLNFFTFGLIIIIIILFFCLFHVGQLAIKNKVREVRKSILNI